MSSKGKKGGSGKKGKGNAGKKGKGKRGKSSTPSPAKGNKKPKYTPQKSTLNSKKPAVTSPDGKAAMHVSIEHIEPNQGAEGSAGIIISCTGYAERCMTQPFYARHLPKNSAFIGQIEAVQRVVTVIGDPDADPPVPLLNGRGHPVKGIVVHVDLGQNPEILRNWVEQTFIPALMNVAPELNTEPVCHPTDFYTRKRTWDDVIGSEDIYWAMQHQHGNVGMWFRAGQSHLYSCYKEGRIPLPDINRFMLNATHLRPLDVATLEAANAPSSTDEEEGIDLDDDEEDDENEEDEQPNAGDNDFIDDDGANEENENEDYNDEEEGNNEDEDDNDDDDDDGDNDEGGSAPRKNLASEMRRTTRGGKKAGPAEVKEEKP